MNQQQTKVPTQLEFAEMYLGHPLREPERTWLQKISEEEEKGNRLNAMLRGRKGNLIMVFEKKGI